MAENKAEKKAEKKANKKPNFLVRAGRYLRDCKNEIKKIVWPTPKAVFRNMGVVLVMIIVIGLFIFGLDYGLTALFSTFMSISHGG
ncbi:MAG: preprotein translocase subunit SecE [Clostridiales bacterium]|jgi:preprotein translocase subunit SecE|nr:preprotein translocase subunit SecE [Clostridiales bacterium]